MELPQAASPLLYALGFMASTAALLGTGYGIGLASRRMTLGLRLIGTVIAFTGLYFLAYA